MITITEKAKETLKELLADNPGKVLSIFLQGHG
jgi:Fe-S cluster assembly iron-binding protein IscA